MTTSTDFQCKICNRGFGSGRALGGHMRQHQSSNGHSPAPVPQIDNRLIEIAHPTPAHPTPLTWIVRKAPHVALMPLIGPLLGMALSGIAGLVIGASIASFGLLVGCYGAYLFARGKLAPRYGLERVSVRSSRSGVVLRKRWVEKRRAGIEMPEARRRFEGESYWVDLTREPAVVFDPTVRDVPHYHLTPQMIRFAVASEPTRVTVNAKLFSIPAEVLHMGASFAVVAVSFFIIWAVIN